MPGQSLTSRDSTIASTGAAGIAGGLSGFLMRGRSSIIPGILTFSLLGFASQSLYSRLDERKSGSLESTQEKPLWHRIADMKWSPMKVLTDEEYGEMLMEKLIKVEADIAILDEDVEKLRGEQQFEDEVAKAREE